MELQINIINKHNASPLSLVSLLKNLSVPSQITRLGTNIQFLCYHVSRILYLNLFVLRVYQGSSGNSSIWPTEIMRSHPSDQDKHDNKFQTD